ncbi:MAG: helix-turn-helix transcriptional regulator [Phycisphaerae bacterium]|nr:helix-turn-helix transcriptional regulator [Phycisphaerae bacterium]
MGPLDARVVAGRIIERRKRAGLTQASLARQAGIRIETLNRIERGKTTPDFSTIRKLMKAVKAAEARVDA